MRLAASDNLKENYTTVVIHVKDVNDNPPVFERPTYRTQITEEDDRNLPKRVLQVFVPQQLNFLCIFCVLLHFFFVDTLNSPYFLLSTPFCCVKLHLVFFYQRLKCKLNHRTSDFTFHFQHVILHCSRLPSLTT